MASKHLCKKYWIACNGCMCVGKIFSQFKKMNTFQNRKRYIIQKIRLHKSIHKHSYIWGQFVRKMIIGDNESATYTIKNSH